MPIGYQTIIWGEEIPNLPRVLDQIKTVGYQGVEFAQSPERLGEPARLERLLQERGLTLLGLAGGTIESRVRFCRDLQVKPLYLYVDGWTPRLTRLMEDLPVPLGLHPHLYQPIDRFSRAWPILQAHPVTPPPGGAEDPARLRFIPDTAHLWLAGDTDLIQILDKTLPWLIAVHMKDWSAAGGRGYANYARGFTELGNGDIQDLRAVWEWLKKNYKGWVVVEQDYTDLTAQESMRISWNWLHRSTDSHRPQRRCAINPLPAALEVEERFQTRPGEMARVLDLLIRDSARGIERVYATVVETLGAMFDCKLCSLWEVSSRSEQMCLRTFWPGDLQPAPRNRNIQLDQALCGSAIFERRILTFDDVQTADDHGRRFQEMEMAQALDLHAMASVPILNFYNANQTELIINLFPRRPLTPQEIDLLDALRPHIACATERALGQDQARASDEINYLMGKCQCSLQALEHLLERVQIHLRCQATSIFLVDPSQTRLELAATTGIVGHRDKKEVWYLRPEEPPDLDVASLPLPVQAWLLNETIGLEQGSPAERDDLERLESMEAPGSGGVLVMPIRDANSQVLGVIRCRGKFCIGPSEPSRFSVTEESLLATILDTAAPHLAKMIASERRSQAFARMHHELQMPVTVMKGALTWISKEMNRNKWKFTEDYVGDAGDYLALMKMLVNQIGFFRPELKLNRDWLLLVKDVAAPAVRHVKPLLDDRGFSERAIDRRGLMQLPGLFLDKMRFEQVFFNMLSNCIKYAHADPDAFHVAILGVIVPNGYKIVFRDYGQGVEEHLTDAVFLEGVRGPMAHQYNVAGDGIGLWIVRTIVQAHGGTISLTRNCNPTEFTIFLPKPTPAPTPKP